MKYVIERKDRSIACMNMSEFDLLKDCKGSEYAMYEVFCRPRFKYLINRVKKEDLFALVYFWYSCEFGMSLEKLIPEKSELFKFGTIAECDMSVDIFGLTGVHIDEENGKTVDTTSEENAAIVRHELIERLTYMHEFIEIE